MPETISIYIRDNNKDIELRISGEGNAKIEEKDDAAAHGEAKFQIKEGCFYEYEILTKGYRLQKSEIVSQSKMTGERGRISPNIYVGTLTIEVLTPMGEKCADLQLEVQSVKSSYRSDYRFMLEEITEQCIDLLLQHSSPVSQLFEVDFNADAKTLYQRFAFVQSIIDSEEFNNALHKIISSPVTRWKENETIKDIRSVKRFGSSSVRQLSSVTNRFNLPEGHSLKKLFNTIPSKLRVSNKTETIDTPENRFVKHALTFFKAFIANIHTSKKLTDDSRIVKESLQLEDKLEQMLSHSVFKQISNLKTIPLNSPVLQRKEGYREVLRSWLMFDLAARLVWHGGGDVYSGNKKDVAVLYEYWLFFKLLKIVQEVFAIKSPPVETLIEETTDGLGLKLRQGRNLSIYGIYDSGTRKLRVKFSYNKTFSGKNSYPKGGSWSRDLRPDYTLSIWPHGINQSEAEEQELMVHIHFDAKYKVESINEILGDADDLDEEDKEQRKGNYKRADLLKMHTYRDAIRRTAGAYVLYPGDKSEPLRGFHEILPGLGAFAIRPSKTNDGSIDLKMFLNDVIIHFLNRASQRERISYKNYDVYKNDSSNELNEPMPEAYGVNRSLIPDETYVLVGFAPKENLEWIVNSGLYNARTGTDRGSLRLGAGEAGAKYLLLHGEGDAGHVHLLFNITKSGPRIFSNEQLLKKGYPGKASQPFYLVYDIERNVNEEFAEMKWDITNLGAYKTGRGSGIPFSITLTELMHVLVKK